MKENDDYQFSRHGDGAGLLRDVAAEHRVFEPVGFLVCVWCFGRYVYHLQLNCFALVWYALMLMNL